MASLERREFLRRATAAVLFPTLTPSALAAVAAPPSRARIPDWVAAARAQIPALASPYFQTGALGPSPRSVMEEMARMAAMQNGSPVGRAILPVTAKVEPALRAHLARAFGAREDEVALTHSTSEGINIAVWSIDWRAGDEVIISNQEHPSNIIPWYVLHDRFGIVIRTISMDAGSPLLPQIREALSPRTRMVSLSHVSRNNGRVIPTSLSAELAALLRGRGVLYHLDGAQAAGSVPLDFHALGADYYSACGHKWLLGPKGTGLFFCRRDRLDETKLTWTGAHSHASMDYEGRYTLLPSAARFEFGTRALADFAGFDRALTWMEDIGFSRIFGRIHELVEYAIERTQTLGRFPIVSPTVPEERSGLFTLRLPSTCQPAKITVTLREQHDIHVSPVRDARDLRLAIHFFNTEDEIDAAIDAVARACNGAGGPA
jgi:L-cysteine/cystine lyase